MPVTSQAQAGFVAMSKSAKGRAKLRAHGKNPMPVKVASEFQTASKGMSFKKLPAHHSKIHAKTLGKSLRPWVSQTR
jgi:hypothetical protein